MQNQQVYISINGELKDKSEAQVSVFDRGFLFGDSIYEVTKTSQKKFEFLEDHLDRLENSADLLHFPFEGLREKTKQQLCELNDKIPFEQAYFRVIITRGNSHQCNIAVIEDQPKIIIIAKKFVAYPQTWYQDGVNLLVSSYRRNHPSTINPNAKSGNYLNNVLAVLEAKKQGYYDALMLNIDGNVAEATTANIWMVKDSTLYTPYNEAGILKGITRQCIFNMAEKLEIPIESKVLSLKDIESAQEIFLTSATKEIVPVNEIYTTHQVQYAIGDITRLLMSKFGQFKVLT